MNLRGVDLNLLVILDALFEEAHVTRASERLGLSQPATSAALDRCRGIFKDPLLERGGASMRLTPRAQEMRQPLRALLAGVDDLVRPDKPDLGSIKRVVRLIMTDYPAIILAQRMLPRLRTSAPGIDLTILPWHGGGDAAERLRRGDADLAVSVLPTDDSEVHRSQLFHESYRVVMRAEHPAAAAFDIDAWLAYPHIVVSGRGERHTPLDDLLLGHGRQRRIGIVVPSFIMAAPLLLSSDLIALLPSRCVPEDPGLAAFDPPVPVDGFPLHLAWHRRSDDDVAIRHVAKLVRELFT